jgi:hypothetical protein
MKSKILATLRETAELSVRYIGVGVCFAVAAVIALSGLNFVPASKGITVAFAVALGFTLSYFFWRYTSSKATISVSNPEPIFEIRGTSPPLFGVGELELPQFATSGSVVYFCMTYAGEEGQSPIEKPIQSPTTAPEVVTIDANLH